MAAARHPNHRPLSSLPQELRRTAVPEHVRTWVARETGSAVERVRRLAGASSTAVHALALADRRRLVLRRYVWPGFLEDEPVAPRREVDALRFAVEHGLPAPAVVAADVDGTAVGDGIPVILMTFLRGRAVAAPDPARLAEVAAAIHATPPDGLGHGYFRWYTAANAAPPPGTEHPALWEAAIELWRDAMPEYRPTLVHRDFHPGNVLWWRGSPSGVVDWANACRGPAGCDVAHCRSNLLTWAGPSAADGFLAAYERLTGEAHHPFWEIASVLEHGPSWWTRARLAESEPRLRRAVRLMGRDPR